MVMLKQILLLIILISANITCAQTLSNLHINSTDLVVDREKMTATFTGNVVLCFEDIKLLGKKVVFYFEDDKIKHIKSIYISQNIRAIQNDGTILLAENAIFEMQKSELRLFGNVVIEKANRIMKAKEMIYRGKISDIMLGK